MRISTEAIYRRFLGGLQTATNRMIDSQEQVATGRRLLRPSDDATAASRVLTLQRELADADRLRESTTLARSFVDAATSALEEASSLISETRALIIQGMNGTLDAEARDAIGQRVELLRQQMIDIANRKSADRFLFSGTETGAEPWLSSGSEGIFRTSYVGNDAQQAIRIGNGAEIAINLPGTSIFSKQEPQAPTFAGLTGVGLGTTASEGFAWEIVEVEQTSFDLGNLASVGVVQAAGTTSDLMQNAALVIDATDGTVRLGNGDPVSIPSVTSTDAESVRLRDEFGAELELDFTGWNGADYTGTVGGSGTIRLGDGVAIPIDFTETDQRLETADGSTVLHVDMTQIRRSGDEMVQFDGAINLFDVLDGVANDMQNSSGISDTAVADRLTQRLSELDRHADNVLVGLGVLGSRSGRLENTAQRFDLVSLQVEGLISESQDADITQAILDLRQAESTLQLSQATGVRLIQRSLLEFIR